MRVCKRGGVGPRDKWGHCLCDACKAAKKATAKDRSEYHKQWRIANPDKVKAYIKKWLHANKEKRRQIEQAWRKANPEKVAAMNARGGAKWAANNKGQRLASVRERQAAKKQRTPAWADRAEMAQIYRECARISQETGVPHEVDHLYPLQGEMVSGLHVPSNLQILPRSENRKKGAKLCES